MEIKRIVKVFLAASPDEFGSERNELGRFFTSINNIFSGRGLYFELLADEDGASAGMQGDAEDVAVDCEFFYVLFYRKADGAVLERFNAAYGQMTACGKPRIVTMFRELDAGEKASAAVASFMCRLDEELGHYYNYFSSLDSVKLSMLLEVARDATLGISLEFRDAEVLLDGQGLSGDGRAPEIDLDNVPFYAKNAALNDLRRKRADMERRFFELRTSALEGDEEAYLESMEANRILNETGARLHAFELELLRTASNVSELSASGEPLTECAKAAIRLFEAGEYGKAKAILDDERNDRDREAAEETADASLVAIEALNKETLLKVDILRAEGITSESAEQIVACYEKARRSVEKHNLDRSCVYDFVSFLADQNDYERAAEQGKRLLSDCEGSYRATAAFLAKVKNLLGIIYADTNRSAESERLYLEALKTYRRLAKANPRAFEPYVAMICSNLAALYGDTNRPAESEQLYLEALEIRRRLAKVNPQAFEPGVATTCNNLANLYGNTNRPAESEQLYLEALEIRRRLAEATPQAFEPDLALTCNNLASLYGNTNRPAESEQLYLEALEIRRRLAKANPQAFEPDVAGTCNNLANLYRQTNRPAESEQLHLEALEAYRRLAEANPRAFEPDVAGTCNNLANLYYDTNRPAESEQLHLEALEIRRRLAEATPQAFEPYVARTCNNLANLYRKTNPAESERLYLEALEISRRLAKANPRAFEPDVATTCNNLAVFFYDTDRPAESESFLLEALEIYRHLAKANPQAFEPDVAATCNGLAELFDATGRPEEASRYHLEANEIGGDDKGK